MIDIQTLFEEYNIEYYTEGHKQCRPGWINLLCPFCESSEPTLGINLSTGAVNCYQCTTHSQTGLIAKLLNISWSKAEGIRKQYVTKNSSESITRKIKERSKPKEIQLPYGAVSLKKKHLEYLRNRGFIDPKKIANEWRLLGTEHLGEYRGRIIAPIFKNEQLVSYQGRDITGKQIPKYKACPKEKEIIHHKNYLYGLWKTNNYSVIVVEGIVDVWKLGPGAVATFGIQWKKEQALLLLSFKKITIVFDPEEQAQIQADKLRNLLTLLGKEVQIINPGQCDPGDMSQKEARNLMKYLLN